MVSQATATKCSRPGGSGHRNILPQVSEVWEFEVKVPVGRAALNGSGEEPFLAFAGFWRLPEILDFPRLVAAAASLRSPSVAV